MNAPFCKPLLCLFLITSVANASDSRPNIILLLADDQSVHSIGCYGNEDVQTPQMDKLGNDGIIFDNHYNTSAICMASRANIVTGRYEYKTGCNFGKGNLSSTLWGQSYPVLLRRSGYLTAFAGKIGFDIQDIRDPATEFDVYGGAPGQTSYMTAKNKSMARYAEKYPHSTLSYGAFGQDVIKLAVQKNKPFCLSISFKAPHRPVTPDPQFDHIYAGKTFTKPGNYGRSNGEHLSEQSKKGRQYGRFTSWNYDKDYDGVMAKYHQQIYAIDVALGMIRNELQKQGVADNTVIIYTSDNGFFCGAHGFGSKVLPYEASARAPLIIYDPRSKSAGKRLRSRALTGNIDFAPTILQLAGLPEPTEMDGKSLLSLLTNPDMEIREQMAFINTWGAIPTQCLTVVTRDWKYIYWWYEGEGMTPTEELFHVRNDPLELQNLAQNPEYSSILKKMRKSYDTELELWQAQAVEQYRPYATLFDRKLPMASKHGLTPHNKKKKK